MIPLVQSKDIVVRWKDADLRDPSALVDKCTAFFHREEVVHVDPFLRKRIPHLTEDAERVVRLRVRRGLYPIELLRELKELRIVTDGMLYSARVNSADSDMVRDRFDKLIAELQSQ